MEMPSRKHDCTDHPELDKKAEFLDSARRCEGRAKLMRVKRLEQVRQVIEAKTFGANNLPA